VGQVKGPHSSARTRARTAKRNMFLPPQELTGIKGVRVDSARKTGCEKKMGKVREKKRTRKSLNVPRTAPPYCNVQKKKKVGGTSKDVGLEKT